MGNTSVGRHGLHIYPFEPAEMILDPQSFFKQAVKCTPAAKLTPLRETPSICAIASCVRLKALFFEPC
jgi:hypothetical protein